MQSTYNDILLEILEIIDYRNDKEVFVKEFEACNYLDAMGILIPQLPEFTQAEIRACGDDVEKIKVLIPKKAFQKEFFVVSVKALDELLVTVAPALTNAQKEKIKKLLKALITSN